MMVRDGSWDVYPTYCGWYSSTTTSCSNGDAKIWSLQFSRTDLTIWCGGDEVLRIVYSEAKDSRCSGYSVGTTKERLLEGVCDCLHAIMEEIW